MDCADDDLWEEIGEEVPAAWDDSQGSTKSKDKPVPPGDYFTVVKGQHVCCIPSTLLLSAVGVDSAVNCSMLYHCGANMLTACGLQSCGI